MGCLNCSKEIENVPQKREKKFCNSTCRSNYWQKQNRAKRKETGIKSSPVIEKIVETKVPPTPKIDDEPVRMQGESSLDFAFRKSEWKLKNKA